MDVHHTGLCFTPHAAGEQPGVSYGCGFHIIDDGKHGRAIGPRHVIDRIADLLIA